MDKIMQDVILVLSLRSFFFVVMVYLFVGAGFEYFVKGARGVEVIPNYAFWIMFFSLVLVCAVTKFMLHAAMIFILSPPPPLHF